MPQLVAIGLVARRQHGLITFEQLLAAGVTANVLRRLVGAGALIPVRRGVYRVSGVPVTWPQAVLAAVLAAGPGAVASHLTAAALWDLKPAHPGSDRIHLTSPRRVRIEGVCAHLHTLAAKDHRARNAIPVTSVERTIFDLAGVIDFKGLGQCVDDALRRDLVRLGRLRQLVDQSAGRGRPPVHALLQVLADRIDGFDPGGSDWERDMDRLWDTLGLPAAVRQYPVSANGHRYVLDRAIPELKIGIEWNGFTTHGTRSGFDSDSDRRADLTSAGWHMVDFTSRSDPERILGAVLGVVKTRSGATSEVCSQ
jgi:hypothetical protein